jgi:hypothetical protein
MPADPPPKAKLDVKEFTETYSLVRCELPPGGVVDPYHRDEGYFVFTATPAKVRRTTYRDGKIEKEEDLVLDPAKPFFVPGFAQGVEVSIRNTGSEVAIFGKRSVKIPDYLNW